MAALNAGSVYYTVEAETDQLLSSNKTIDASIDKTANSFKKLDTQVTKTSSAVNGAISGMGRSAGMAGIQIQQFVGQIQGGQNAMVALSQQSADLGFVLGAPLVGAVVGISASLVGILLPSLFDSEDGLKELEKATESLSATFTLSSSGVVEYTEKMQTLAQVSSSLAKIKLSATINEQKAAMETAANVISNSVVDAIGDGGLAYKSAVEDLFGVATDEAYLASFEIKKAAETIANGDYSSAAIENLSSALDRAKKSGIDTTKAGQELIGTISDMIVQIKNGEKSINDLNGKLQENNLDLSDTGKATGALTKKYSDLVSALKIKSDTLGMSRSETLKYNKVLALNQAEVDNQSQSVKDSIAASYDRQIAYAKETEATKAQTDADKKAKTAKDKLDSSKKQAVNKADKLIHSADNRFQKLEKEREDIKADYDKRLIDKQKFDEAMAALDAKNADAEDYIKGDSSPLSGGGFDNQEARYKAEADKENQRYADQQKRLKEAKEAEIQVKGGYQALEADMAQQHEDRLSQIQTAATDARLKEQEEAAKAQLAVYSTVLSSAQTLTSGIMDTMDEQSAGYKVLFAAQKAFAFAQAIIAAESAAAQVLSHDAGIMGMGAIATSNIVRGLGYASAGVIAGTAIAGGRQYGGPVSSNGMYRINENGAPEVFNAANGQQYMLPNTRGEVVSNKDASGGGSVNIVVNVASDGSATTNGGSQMAQFGKEIGDFVAVKFKQLEANSMRPGGALWNARQRGR